MEDITSTQSCSVVLAFVELDNVLFQCPLIEHAIFQAETTELDKSIFRHLHLVWLRQQSDLTMLLFHMHSITVFQTCAICG